MSLLNLGFRPQKGSNYSAGEHSSLPPVRRPDDIGIVPMKRPLNLGTYPDQYHEAEGGIYVPPVRETGGDLRMNAPARAFNLGGQGTYLSLPNVVGKPFLPDIRSAPGASPVHYSAVWSDARRGKILAVLKDMVMSKYGIDVWNNYEYSIENYSNAIFDEAYKLPSPPSSGYAGAKCADVNVSNILASFPSAMRKKACEDWMGGNEYFAEDLLKMIEWYVFPNRPDVRPPPGVQGPMESETTINPMGVTTGEHPRVNKGILIGIPVGIIGIGLAIVLIITLSKRKEKKYDAGMAYEISDEDIRNVVGRSLSDKEVDKILEQLDLDKVEEAALMGDAIDEQTDYAYDEIRRQLNDLGIKTED